MAMAMRLPYEKCGRWLEVSQGGPRVPATSGWHPRAFRLAFGSTDNIQRYFTFLQKMTGEFSADVYQVTDAHR